MTQLQLKEEFKNWVRKVEEPTRREQMSLDLAKLFMILLSCEERGEEVPKPDFLEFSHEVAEKRAKAINLEINDPALILICFLSDGIPGNIVMYLYFLKQQQLERKVPITVKEMAVSIFPFGFISKNGLSELWEEQKVVEENGLNRSRSNLLDLIDFEP